MPLIAKNKGSNDGNVFALSAGSGALLWSYTNGGGYSSPTVADGAVYIGIGLDNGGVNAFSLPDSGGAKEGPAPERLDPKTLHPDFSLKPSKPVATQ
jgi:hypothetical protein